MPLHLLGKKSWNVYNSDNVERVRRDEADARAREEAAEQRMQQQDADRRMALLRGEQPPALPAQPADDEEDDAHGRGKRLGGDDESAPRGRKRRRLKGEDDTDREMRFAREDAEDRERARRVLRDDERRGPAGGGRGDDAPLQDREGHIQLVPVPEDRSKRKADEKEETQRRKKDDNEEQQGMRFTDAAGYRKGTSKPWYASSESRTQASSRSANELMLAELQGKDVWGNEDPRRKEREQNRITSSDPFAMMQQAQKQLKRSETDREKWQKDRDRELQKLKHEGERRQRHERKHESRRSRRREGRHDKDEDELEDFSLDGLARGSSKGHCSDHDRHHHRHRRSHHRRERSRSRSREHRRK